MRTPDEIAADLDALEADLEKVARYARLEARAAGIESRCLALGVPAPPELEALCAEIGDCCAAEKAKL